MIDVLKASVRFLTNIIDTVYAILSLTLQNLTTKSAPNKQINSEWLLYKFI